MNNKPKVKYKTIHYEYRLDNKSILNNMSTTSKNIYNCCVYSNKIFSEHKNNIYKHIYYLLSKNKINNSTIESVFQKRFHNYYYLYTNNKTIFNNNNSILYNFIKDIIITEKIILNSTNIDNFKARIFIEAYHLVNFNNNIINKIIKSFYSSCYYKIKNELINHKPLTYNDNILINEIKNNNFYYDNYIDYKKKIEIDFDVHIKSDQLLFKNCVYNYCLGDNKEKLPADVILNLIDHYHQDLKSYYNLIKNDFIKARKPNYLNKNDKYNLFYYSRSFKIINNKIRLTVGKYISDNYNKYQKHLYKINNRLYCLKHNLQTEIKKSTKQKFINKYFIKTNDGYINKNKIIDANYIYINLPKAIKNKKIKLIQIQPYGNKYYIYINYEYNENNEKLNFKKMSIKNSISIDPGIKNLMTIYNPTGNQHIIHSKLVTINEFYNKKIAELKSINKKQFNLNSFNRLYSLLNERENKINIEINNIINLLLTTYPDKRYFIMGYNEKWKNKVNLGSKTNRIFYNIPYKRILDKLDSKLKSQSKYLIKNEESFTSKCDSLNLENISKHEIYDGQRIFRGLFLSKTGKTINADLNAAINIMRKKINLTEIKGLNIFNPIIIST